MTFDAELDLRQFTTSRNEAKKDALYRLVAVIQHEGNTSLEKGHFIAYVLRDQTWYKIDDYFEDCEEIQLEQFQKRFGPYMTFYEKVEQVEEEEKEIPAVIKMES